MADLFRQLLEKGRRRVAMQCLLQRVARAVQELSRKAKNQAVPKPRLTLAQWAERSDEPMPTITAYSPSFLSTYALAVAAAAATACASQAPEEPAAELTSSLQHVLDQSVAQTDELLPGAISHYRHAELDA